VTTFAKLRALTKFRKSSASGSEYRNFEFWRIRQHCVIGYFSTVCLISLDKLIGSSWKFYERCILDKEIRITFRQSSGSGILIRIRTPDADLIRLDGGLRCPSALVENIFTDYKTLQYYKRRTWIVSYRSLCLVARTAEQERKDRKVFRFNV